MPNDRAAAGQMAAYTAIENGQARDARKIAEALFQPKPTTKTDDPAQPAATTQQEVARVPRILTVTEPRDDSIPSQEPGPQPSPGASKPVAAVLESEHSRIRTLLAYGMTVGEVAELYDVAKDEIEHIVKG